MNKSEKERMLAGEFYNSRDPELLAMYHRARRLLGEFNHTASSDAAMKEHLLRELLGKLGRGVWI
ncbi:MAG: sugar O-acetyltransferase, partial [Calditrichaeota bacterium]|nr:sugar O-acetyltransferase [Calditrichota bacterium]